MIVLQAVIMSFFFPYDSTKGNTEVFRNPNVGLKVAEATNRFAVDLFRSCANIKEGNLFISPFSIYVALAMTYSGTDGDTKEEMRRSLHLTGIDDQLVHETIGDLQKAVMNNSEVTMQLANGLFGAKSHKFLAEFLNISDRYYDTDQQNMDFANPTGVENLINHWVEEKTHSKINDIIAKGSLDALTKLVLINAIYFKGNWLNEFDKSSTREDKFHGSDGKTFTAPFMYKKEKYLFGHNGQLKCTYIELPYSGKEFGMHVYLPFRRSNVADLEKNLKFEHLTEADMVFKTARDEAELWFPRFALESSFKLKDALSSLGIKHLFVPGEADLSKMDGTRDLYVNDVLHKAFINVTEEGSEASAATAVKIEARMAGNELLVNRPFIFTIKHRSTNSVLFIGKYENQQ